MAWDQKLPQGEKRHIKWVSGISYRSARLTNQPSLPYCTIFKTCFYSRNCQEPSRSLFQAFRVERGRRSHGGERIKSTRRKWGGKMTEDPFIFPSQFLPVLYYMKAWNRLALSVPCLHPIKLNNIDWTGGKARETDDVSDYNWYDMRSGLCASENEKLQNLHWSRDH